MAEGRSLKEQTAGLIRAAMTCHIVAFIWIAIEPLQVLSMSGSTLLERIETAAGPGAAASGLIVVTSLLLLGAINPNLRNRLIHWRWRNPLPGCRAFTIIGPQSSHVNMAVLEAQYETLSVDGKAQNQLFFQIYREF